jgi:hypothetical protein
MSTLPPTPSYNPNIPVVTSSGGTSAAYKDPNSPESIMKKTTLLQAQAAVDTTYDVNPAAVEGFKGFRRRKNDKFSLLFFAIAIMFLIYLRGRALKPYAKVFLIILAASLIIFTIILQQNGGSPGTKAGNN